LNKNGLTINHAYTQSDMYPNLTLTLLN